MANGGRCGAEPVERRLRQFDAPAVDPPCAFKASKYAWSSAADGVPAVTTAPIAIADSDKPGSASCPRRFKCYPISASASSRDIWNRGIVGCNSWPAGSIPRQIARTSSRSVYG